MNILYEHSRTVTVEQFRDVLSRTTLGPRRPLHDPAALASMLRHGNLLCTAWDGDKLVGIARSLTDFDFICYLSDLAVDENYQRLGIGKELVRVTKSRLQPQATIVLFAAPQAENYYSKIGFDKHPSGWVMPGRQ